LIISELNPFIVNMTFFFGIVFAIVILLLFVMENFFSLHHRFFTKMYESLRKSVLYPNSSKVVFSLPKAFPQRALLIVLFLVLGQFAFAQRDQIITQAGEKIRCRILDETPTRFIYAYLGPNNKVLRNEIFKNLVTDFKYNQYSSDIVVKGGAKLPDAQMTGKDEPAGPRIDTRKSSGNSSKGSTKSSSKNSSQKEEASSQARKNDETEDSKKSDEVAESRSTESKKSDSRSSSKKEESNSTESKKEDARSAKKEESRSDESKKSNSSKKDESKASKQETARKKEEEARKQKEIDKLKSEEIESKKEDEKAEAPLAQKVDKNDFRNYLKFRVGIRGGLGNLLTKSTATDEFGLYREKLNRGYTFGGDMTYFFGEHFGMGATFNNYISSNKAESIKYIDFDGKEATGSTSNNISTKFVGPTVAFRKAIDYKTFVILTAGPGVYFYQDKAKFGESPIIKVKGQDFGAAATLGLDFLLGNDITGRDVIISLEAGYNYGKMKMLNYGSGAVTLDKPLDLSRVDFTIGLRFARYPKYLKLNSY
jgi:hypothetical protein